MLRSKIKWTLILESMQVRLIRTRTWEEALQLPIA